MPMLQFETPADSPANIKVVGIGGAGCNAVNRMIASNLQGIRGVSAGNTQYQVTVNHHLLGKGLPLDLRRDASPLHPDEGCRPSNLQGCRETRPPSQGIPSLCTPAKGMLPLDPAPAKPNSTACPAAYFSFTGFCGNVCQTFPQK